MRARNDPYTGPAIDLLPNWTAQEKTLLKTKLPELVAERELRGKGMGDR